LKAARPWLTAAEKVGALHSQLFGGSLKSVTIRLGGDPVRFGFAPITIAALKGLLTPICGDTVNFVNAPALAKERGIAVNESKMSDARELLNFIDIETLQDDETHKITATVYNNEHPHIVRIDEFTIDLEPNGFVIFIKNEDQPGVVGKVGTILGRNKVNIAEMTLGRVAKGKKVYAMTVINTDENVPEKVLKEIRKFPPIIDAKVVRL